MAKKTLVMYAIGWHRWFDEKCPDPLECEPWMLCYTREIAKEKRAFADQKIKKVKVTIEKNTK